MIEILWIATSAKGYTDCIPLHLVADEGFRADASYEMLGPKGQKHTARCSVDVQGSAVVFSYGERHARENLENRVVSGQMKVEFSDPSRSTIKSVTWRPDGRQAYEEAPVRVFMTEDDAPEDMRSVLGVEGAARLVSHLRRERKAGLRDAKIQAEGAIRCEACGFDFGGNYGNAGHSACEVHHRVALASGPREISLADLAILCANCHRVIHRSVPMLNVPEFAKLYGLAGRGAA